MMGRRRGVCWKAAAAPTKDKTARSRIYAGSAPVLCGTCGRPSRLPSVLQAASCHGGAKCACVEQGLALIARTCSSRTRRAARAASKSLRLADAFVSSTTASAPALEGHELQRRLPLNGATSDISARTTAKHLPSPATADTATEKTLARRRRLRSRSRQHARPPRRRT